MTQRNDRQRPLRFTADENILVENYLHKSGKTFHDTVMDAMNDKYALEKDVEEVIEARVTEMYERDMNIFLNGLERLIKECRDARKSDCEATKVKEQERVKIKAEEMTSSMVVEKELDAKRNAFRKKFKEYETLPDWSMGGGLMGWFMQSDVQSQYEGLELSLIDEMPYFNVCKDRMQNEYNPPYKSDIWSAAKDFMKVFGRKVGYDENKEDVQW